MAPVLPLSPEHVSLLLRFHFVLARIDADGMAILVASELLGQESRLDLTQAFLQDLLGDSPVPSGGTRPTGSKCGLSNLCLFSIFLPFVGQSLYRRILRWSSLVRSRVL